MENKKTNSHSSDYPQVQDDDTSEVNRREFLKRAGKFAAYTPPALMMLMQPSYAKMAKSGGGNIGNIFHGVNKEISINKGISKSDGSKQDSFQSLLDWLRNFLRHFLS